MKVLVTGSNGQLGRSLQKVAKKYPKIKFIFTDVEELDITKQYQVIKHFIRIKPDFCVNCAAYTKVDEAEDNSEKCYYINETGAANLAIAAKFTSSKMIHISSEYVYFNDDEKVNTEDFPTNPQGVYAKSKLAGEKKIIENLQKHMIIRTSWLYSEFGNNFVDTIINLAKTKKQLKVVDDQIGSPTYATDLAETILKIITSKTFSYGVFNYSNLGFTSWFHFAKEIVNKLDSKCKVKSISSSQYPTKAPRPLNSKMSKNKISSAYGITIPKWKNSLAVCMKNLNDK